MRLHDTAAQCVDDSASAHAAKLGEVLQLDADISVLESVLAGRPEQPLLGNARRQLGGSVYAASTGMYVHAYAGLRVFLELGFAAVYFSANEFERRRWISDRRDFSWSRALDVDEGVLSPGFVQEFLPDASVESLEFATTAAKCYRSCSQFIHGKNAVIGSLPTELSYSFSDLSAWIDCAIDAGKSVVFLLFVRYADEILRTDRADEFLDVVGAALPQSPSLKRFLESLK